MRECGLDSTVSVEEPLAYLNEVCNKTPGSIKSGDFIDQLKDCDLLRMDSSPWSEFKILSLYSNYWSVVNISVCYIIKHYN